MAGRPFQAKYEGHCFECGEMISVGEGVMFDDDGDLCHEGCYTDSTSFDPTGDDEVKRVKFVPVAEEKPCEKCYLVHAGDCF
ncbi:hypothetical protein [Mycobacteroides abscessus]|uniref:hypothetical protein n=1 Tax=Mycobacteroides abscessus TaxID=36809 RepID=UPI00092B3F59|nr:hypothetical protein [Mycobacteroides abscessus]DAZ90328.1 TPA_asm: hypothetical protein PROPHIFSQJ01-1_42 [Mycobacterium phage prophiFSQJ01-1]SII40938.1 Uncharacterised protein [Mycobacteroides abscessus subsp. abscessus]SIK14268.1 Uncharacterised protein [Mycobacteroides abscessus subsp. abscessus]SIN25346.1 Uncharacterised protein [Mycobacteroides abscessus subsp. abscessus]SLI51579.1 Uncharacterised protein [Mycobacteroides abscessus subsp. abscessus]